MDTYIKKRALLNDVVSSLIVDKHVTPEGSMVHRQEHSHLMKIIEKQKDYTVVSTDEALGIIAQIFNEIESMMSTNEYHDPEFGNWTETCVEIDIDTLNELRNKYFDMFNNLTK